MTFTRWIRFLPLAALVLALPLVAFACGDDDDDGANGERTSVTLMLNWTPNTQHAGIYIALANGWYDEAGIDLSIVEPAAGGVEQVVGAGQAEFGISVQEAVIPAREQGVPIVSIGAILQHNDSSLMALASEGISTPKDLEGKKYGGYGGSLETELISRLVACDGGDPARVDHVEVGNVDYLVGMEQGQYDFVWVFEGWDVLRAKNTGEAVSTILFKDYLDCIPDWYTPVFITSEKLIEDRPDVVRRFMEVTARGYVEAGRDATAAADALLAAAPELDEELVRTSAEYHIGKYMDEGRQWGLQDLATWSKFMTFLIEAGLVERPIDVQKAYTNEFLPDQ